MNKIIVLFATVFALSACASTSNPVDSPENQPAERAEAAATQGMPTESGLGTIAYNEKTVRKKCKRRRRTGSHLYTDSCADPDSGSRPVRQGDWNSVGRYIIVGGGPND